MIGAVARKLFGSSNDRRIRTYRPRVDAVNALERELAQLSDEALRARTDEFKKQLADGKTLDDILVPAFATVREAGKRTLGQRHFDVQLIGGMVLHEGRISEMKTGEGKTLVATLPVYLNALTGRGVHVVTVNDYLARRDAEWMGQIYKFLGLSVGVIVHGLDDAERKRQYECDVTYGTNNELGFDYLRDNMKYRLEDMVQRGHVYAIVDEVDSILIDEARTPLIISGPLDDRSEFYNTIDAYIPKLDKADYEVDEKQRTVTLTELGMERLEQWLREAGLLKSDSLYDVENVSVVHHVNQGLRAHKLFQRDKDYIVRNGEVVIIDEFTGRMMPGRRYSEGLHQALEAKERQPIQPENQTLASITFQNYFRMYEKLAGMTGTAATEADEFQDIYKLEVLEIPTNMPMVRLDDDDEVYRTAAEKFRAILSLIEDCKTRGQPVLVGTTSIEKSEQLAEMLRQQGWEQHDFADPNAFAALYSGDEGASKAKVFAILNARYHEQEAYIVAQAGVPGAITIATNMAGRGTDIQLGGNADMRIRQELKDFLDSLTRIHDVERKAAKVALDQKQDAERKAATAELALKQRAEREAAEAALCEKQRAEREAAQAKLEKTRAEREAAEAALAEKQRVEREAAEGALTAKQRVEREAVEVALTEKQRAEREAAEAALAERQRAEREAAEAALPDTKRTGRKTPAAALAKKHRGELKAAKAVLDDKQRDEREAAQAAFDQAEKHHNELKAANAALAKKHGDEREAAQAALDAAGKHHDELKIARAALPETQPAEGAAAEAALAEAKKQCDERKAAKTALAKTQRDERGAVQAALAAAKTQRDELKAAKATLLKKQRDEHEAAIAALADKQRVELEAAEAALPAAEAAAPETKGAGRGAAQAALAEQHRAELAAAKAKLAEKQRAEREAAEAALAERQRAERVAAEAALAERQDAERKSAAATLAERQRAERAAAEAKFAERQGAERKAAEAALAERQRAELEAAKVKLADKQRAERDAAEAALARKHEADREAAEAALAEKQRLQRETAEVDFAAKIRAQVALLKDKALKSGGLFVLGTERHESRRIDNQLRGRSGRQGDPGHSKFFLSLEDDLMRIFGTDKLDGMLTKLGLKENEAIIHPWINKALEKAQQKVEARNFDIRKNILKFDNVMNDQRKVIFDQRVEWMQDETVVEVIADMRHTVIDDLVAKHVPENAYPEQWDTAGLKEEIKRVLALELPVDQWAKEEGIADEEIFARVERRADEHMAAKVAQWGSDVIRYIEKSILLQSLDHLWREHLIMLDHLRQVIGLRGYGQRDPLNEYKAEAFSLFEAMSQNLREAVTAQLMRVEIMPAPPPEPQPAALPVMAAHKIDPTTGQDEMALASAGAETLARHGIGSGVGGAASAAARAPQSPARNPKDPTTWGKVGRNEPCPCGSGKKFKHCHGRYV